MKKVLLLLSTTLVLLSNHIMANETRYGFGVGLNQGASIFLPIKFDTWLIEPSLSYYDHEDEASRSVNGRSYKRENISVGTGIYKLSDISEMSNLYMGLRLGLVKYKSESTSGTTSYNQEGKGYFLSPTIGLQFNYNTNFSLALEYSLGYSKTKGTTTSSYDYPGTSDDSSTSTSTSSQVILRYVY